MATHGLAFTAENVERTVLAFYGGSPAPASAATQAASHEWLTKAQSSPEAWTFAWDLVDVRKNQEVQFFGANTLVTKLSKSLLTEVPADQFAGLKEKMLALLANYYQGPRIVSTRLCVAVAAMVIHGSPQLWPHPLQELLQRLQADMNQQGVHVLTLLMELLTIIPEEFTTQAMPSLRRGSVREEMVRNQPHVLQLIRQVFGHAQLATEVRMRSIKCLTAWVQFGLPITEVEELFDRLMTYLNEEELFECALDSMAAMIGHTDTHKHPATVQRLLGKILPLDQILYRLMADDASEMASPLASLFITFGESHARLLIDWTLQSEEGRNYANKLVLIILQISSCSAQYPTHETISELPFGFWYILQDDIIADEPQQYEKCVVLFGPVYQQLVNAMLKKSMYPLNDDGWNSEQKELLRCYRTDVADTIMYCYNILRENLLKILLGHLDQAITQCQQNPQVHWNYLEACLYSWSAIGESIAEDGDGDGEDEVPHCPMLVQFLTKLPTIPYNNNTKVISSALDCIGGFAEYLSNYPQLILHLLPIVTGSLTNPELSLCASMALKDITRESKDNLRPYATDILTACRSALAHPQMKPGESVRLMYPIGKMLSVLPNEQVMVHLEQILTPYLMELQGLSAQQAVVAPAQEKNRIMFILKLLTNLFLALELGHDEAEAQQQLQKKTAPILALFTQLFPLTKSVAFKWAKDVDIMHSVWTFLKQSTASLIEDGKSFVPDIVQLLVSCYAEQPNYTALILLKHLITLFGKDPSLKDGLSNMLAQINSRTIEHMQSTGNASDHAELIQDYFQLISYVVKRETAYVSVLDVLRLFQCACFCLTMPEISCVKYAASFLATFVHHSRDVPSLQAVVLGQGEHLLRQVIVCVADESAKNCTDYYTEILFSLVGKYCANFVPWMEAMIREDNFPTIHVTMAQKQQFAERLLQEANNRRKMHEVVRAFSMTCQGLMTETANVWDRLSEKEQNKNKQGS